MIVVTGANGQLGRAVVQGLLTRLSADRIVASVRDPAKATELAERGAHVRAGDFAEPNRLAAAFAGATQVLVVSVDKLGEKALQLHHAAIEAAHAAGARRVLYTSHVGARGDSPFAPAPDHAATEAFLAEGGVPFTSLRHGFYAESALHLIGHGLQTGEIHAPEDGPVSWTTRADLAEADAILLAEEGRLDGITPPLTAPEAFTMADLAAIASELTGATSNGSPFPTTNGEAREWRRAHPRRWRRCCSACIEPPGAATSPRSIRRWRRCLAAARKRCAACSPPLSSPPKPDRKPARAFNPPSTPSSSKLILRAIASMEGMRVWSNSPRGSFWSGCRTTLPGDSNAKCRHEDGARSYSSCWSRPWLQRAAMAIRSIEPWWRWNGTKGSQLKWRSGMARSQMIGSGSFSGTAGVSRPVTASATV